MLMFILGLIVIFLSLIYLYFRAIASVYQKRRNKIIGFIILFSCAFSMVIGVFLTRNFESASLIPARTVSLMSGFYLLTFCLFIARDVFYLPLKLIEYRVGMTLHMATFIGSRHITFFMLPLCLCGSLVGLISAIRVPDVKNVEIEFAHLPASLDGFTITQITDLHTGTGSNGSWLKKVVAKVNDLQADMIVLTGDIVDHAPAILGEDMKVLGELKAKYGEYFILGNHEYYTLTREWIDYFEQLGKPFLINETKLVPVDNAYITVTGLADLAGNRQDFIDAGLFVDHEKALSYVDEEIFNSEDTFNLLLMHQPKGASLNAEYGYDLQLSGHTHGGQVFLLFKLVAAANDGFRLGLYEVGKMLLYVSSGTSQWGYWSMRLGAPSEITYITLKKKQA